MSKPVLTIKVIQTQLATRVSAYNARLMLQSAMVDSGLKIDSEAPLSAEQVKGLCLELIRKGGPSFQIGRQLHQQFVN